MNNNKSQQIVSTKTYTYADQEKFAILSGDFNPIHMNPGLARREIFGEIVVHGVHSVIEAFNLSAAYLLSKKLGLLTSLKVKFFNPLFTSQEVNYQINALEDEMSVEVRDQKGLLLTEMKIVWAPLSAPASEDLVLSKSFIAMEPDQQSLQAMSQLEGECDLYLDKSLCNNLFPDLLKVISANQVAELVTTTRIVGMKCPGLQSLFSGIDLKYEPVQQNVVKYRVKKTIEKFSIITLGLAGPSLSGELLTLFRPLVSRQPTMTDIVSTIPAGTFQNMNALIIGGSRGIGETTAKIIAAGGGNVIITYFTGKVEADEICTEVQQAGFSCRSMQIGIENLAESVQMFSGTDINAIFYYPSPKILGSHVFDSQLFQRFCYYYVQQFSVLVKWVKLNAKQKTVIFYPSTVAIDEKTPGLTEYSMAKYAGEYLCENFNVQNKNIFIYVKRLPRLQTDQTLNLQNYPAETVKEVMYPVLLEINNLVAKPN